MTIQEIIQATTSEFRKGEAVEKSVVGNLEVVEVFAMPHINEAPKDIVLVDVIFEWVGVDLPAAEAHKAELVEWLNQYPGGLIDGPSYIAVGAELGDQGLALRLFALGEVLGLWQVITPKNFLQSVVPGASFNDQQVKDMAGNGFIMISGYKKP